ncbi:MAG: transglutaminase-like domain-containing protein [Candidatus Omnitrophica bacterium]|nr:transglutaminase-like domain-containing protein [Candidatus Omnitrophota bacterium]
MRGVKIPFILVAMVCILSAGAAFSQELAGIPAYVKTPTDLANWMSEEFTYAMEYPDRWQSPQETIDKKGGDCDDFAILASAMLSNFNIDNDIVLVEFKGMNVAHLLCVWKNQDGTYSFISNKKLYNTGEEYLSDAIAHFYPDCSKFTLANKMKTAYRYYYNS